MATSTLGVTRLRVCRAMVGIRAVRFMGVGQVAAIAPLWLAVVGKPGIVQIEGKRIGSIGPGRLSRCACEVWTIPALAAR